MNAAIPKALPSYTLACPPSESYTSKFKTGKGKDNEPKKLTRDKSKYLKGTGLLQQYAEKIIHPHTKITKTI